MALPASGTIKLSDLRTEFNGATVAKLGDYHKNGVYVTASAVAPNVPVSGAIDMSDFYGASVGVVGTYLPAGAIYAWGRDDSGHMAIPGPDGSTYWTPRRAGIASDWRYVASGIQTTMAMKFNGTLWSTGLNTSGQLGLGDTLDRNTFTQVGTNSTWARVSVRRGNNYDTHVVATRTDGTLWSWGFNGQGQLGLGDITNRSVPTQVGTGTNWLKVVCADHMTLALKTDGTLWTWGDNANGTLGLGDFTQRTTPTQIGGGTTWKDISSNDSYSLALKTDGTLWGWGWNQWQQLFGLPYYDQIITPTQLGTDTWKYICAGYQRTLLIKSDGTLWGCGWNQLGQLGLGNFTNYISSLTQMSSDTDWVAIEGEYFTTLAKKADGTLWITGYGGLGGLGLGIAITSLNVFTKIDTTINWNQVASNARSSLATILPDYSQNTITAFAGGSYGGWFGPNYPYGHAGTATTSPWYVNGQEVLQVGETTNFNQFTVVLDGNTKHLDVDLMVNNVVYSYVPGAEQAYIQAPPFPPGHPNGISVYYFTIPTGSPYFVNGVQYNIKLRIYQRS